MHHCQGPAGALAALVLVPREAERNQVAARSTFHKPRSRIRTSIIRFCSKMCKNPLIASITQTAKALRQSTLWQ